MNHMETILEMNTLHQRKTVLIALVVCQVITYVRPATSNGNSALISTTSEDRPIPVGFKDDSDGLVSLMGQFPGSLNKDQGDGSNPVNINQGEQEDDTHTSISPGDIKWKDFYARFMVGILQKRAPMRDLGIKAPREKREVQKLDKRLSYDRMGKRGFEGKRFTDAMRLGKRSTKAPLLAHETWKTYLTKRYGDAMRLGKRTPMDSMRLGKRFDAMRLGKRMDAMRLGKRFAMDTMRLGKRFGDELRYGKRMDQMRLGKRNFNKFMLDDSSIHSMNQGKRMGDVMRLGKRSDEMANVEPRNLYNDVENHGRVEFDNQVDTESDEDGFTLRKRMSDLMRLGKRSPVEVKRMSDLMRLGKRFGYDDRFGKRHFMDDEMRMGKRRMDEMRMGKRMGDVMRLGKRAPDGMRLGKRSSDYISGLGPIQYDFDDSINENNHPDAEEQ